MRKQARLFFGKLISGYADRVLFEHLAKILWALEADLSEIIEVELVGDDPAPPKEGRYERVNRNAAVYKAKRKERNAQKRKQKAIEAASGKAKPKAISKAKGKKNR